MSSVHLWLGQYTECYDLVHDTSSDAVADAVADALRLDGASCPCVAGKDGCTFSSTFF